MYGYLVPFVAPLFVFELLREERFYDFQYLAAGTVRDRLKKARQAWEQEKAILEDIKAHFGASRVSIASTSERESGFPELKKSGGFQIHFKKGEQPEGWYRPQTWDADFRKKQACWDDYVYLPPHNSGAQIHLLQKQLEVIGLLADSGLPVSKGVEYYTEGGWYNWSAIALYGENLMDRTIHSSGKFHADIIAPGIFVLTVRSRDENFTPTGDFSACPAISKLDAAWLKAHPEQAAKRLERLDRGKRHIRTMPERIAGALRL